MTLFNCSPPIRFLLLSITAVILLTACGSSNEPIVTSDVAVDPLPSLQATIAIPDTPEATEDPTLGLPPTFTPQPPEPTMRPTATRDASLPTPTVTPDPHVTPEINLTTGFNDPFMMGDVIEVSGRAQLRTDQAMEAALLTLDGRVLTAQRLEVGQFNTWSAELTVPNQYSGQARVFVGIANPNGNIVALENLMVTILPRTDGETRYLRLDQPSDGVIASAGYYFYFSGRAQNPAKNLVTIQIRTEDCRTVASKHSLVLNGSGAWEGFVQVPTNVTESQVCAVAFFGEEGSAEWREFQWLVPVQAYAAKAPAVSLGHPTANAEIEAGRTLNIYGTAAHAPNDEVRLTMNLADGSVAATEVATVDRFGYWEAEILVPVSTIGEVQLVVAVGENGIDEASQVVFLTVPAVEE